VKLLATLNPHSTLHPFGVGKSSTGQYDWGYGGLCSLVSGGR